MRRPISFSLVVCFLLAAPALGATKVFLHVGASAVNWHAGTGSNAVYMRLANTTQGSSKTTFVTNSIAGPITAQQWPSSYIITATAGGVRGIWLSAPLSSAVTISGTITPNFWGLESNGTCNCGFRYEVLRWSKAEGGFVSSLGISTNDGATEWGTSAAVRTAPTLSPTSTNFAAGDRIGIVIYNDDASGTTEGSGKTWTLDYDAATGVDGDSYLSFTESLSFNSDTNDSRPIPMASILLPQPDEIYSPAVGLAFLSWVRRHFARLADLEAVEAGAAAGAKLSGGPAWWGLAGPRTNHPGVEAIR
jgi:hypothetical protein